MVVMVILQILILMNITDDDDWGPEPGPIPPQPGPIPSRPVLNIDLNGYCQIQELQLSKVPSDGIFDNLSKLEFLYLYNNPIQELLHNSYYGLSSIFQIRI